MSPGRAKLRAPAEAPPAGAVRGTVLIVDDEPLLLRALERILRPEGHRVLSAESPSEMEERLAETDVDVVLLDVVLGPHSGLEILEALGDEHPEIETIVMTGHASIESAVGSMRRGAFDYLAKPFDDNHRVRTAVRQALDRRRLVRRNRALEEELRERGDGPRLVGASPPMRALARMLQSLRHNESTVLILGESGTGKELVARAIHAASPRRERAFVPVDCGALPESIIESELFGHERGAFTGATGAPGLFRMAEGGTLFLDEIGEVPPSVQAKLLRALQNREIRPVGGSQPVPVDIRVVAATHQDLGEMVSEGRFRLDLYYRLNVVRIEVPPLRDRGEDVALLAHHFLHKHRRSDSPVSGIEPEALERLLGYAWPGNVRELENRIESALALAAGPHLGARDLRLESAARNGGSQPPGREVPLTLEAFERCALERALAECGGDATRAARRLGIGRSTFYRKLAKHGIGPRRATVGVSEPIR